MKDLIKKAFLEAERVQSTFLTEENVSAIEEIATTVADTFRKGNKVIICGNGGSCCDAMHFAEEFTGRFRKDRRPLPVIPLSDASHITCVANDYGFEYIFSKGVEAYGNREDVFIGISTSGNSQNVLNAVKKANEIGLVSIGLLGKDGGSMKVECQKVLVVPGDFTDRIQEMHIKILHIIIETVERILFPDLY